MVALSPVIIAAWLPADALPVPAEGEEAGLIP
jgi:hypothetical protein